MNHRDLDPMPELSWGEISPREVVVIFVGLALLIWLGAWLRDAYARHCSTRHHRRDEGRPSWLDRLFPD